MPVDSLRLLPCISRDPRTESRYLVKYLEYSTVNANPYVLRAYE